MMQNQPADFDTHTNWLPEDKKRKNGGAEHRDTTHSIAALNGPPDCCLD